MALFFAVGAGAYAAASNPFVSSTGTIEGCVGKGGALSVVKAGKRCPKRTSALPFSQTGPRGVTGAKGVHGTDGANGETAAFYKTAPGAVTFTTSVGSFKTITSETLPAGAYSITGSVLVAAGDSSKPGSEYAVTCELADGLTSYQAGAAGVTSGPFDGAVSTLPLDIDMRTTGSTTVSIGCEDSADGGDDAFVEYAQDAEISAVQVQRVTTN